MMKTITKIKHLLILPLVLLLGSNQNIAQNVGIGSESFTPHESAMLEVQATDKGMLVPRVDIEDLSTAAPVANPAVSLLVYNTNETTGEGFYYWNGTEWALLSGSSSGGIGKRYLGEEYLGGIIFYLYYDDDGDQRGLIVSINETTTFWQHPSFTTGANKRRDGVYNTNMITGSPAKNWITNNFSSEWYLPSIDELGLLYQNRFYVNLALHSMSNATPFIATFYWSSTEINSSTAYTFSTSNGYESTNGGHNKPMNAGVRAIRAF